MNVHKNARLTPCGRLLMVRRIEQRGWKVADAAAAAKVLAIVRKYGHAHTEIWAATEWGHFKQLIRDLAATEAGGDSCA